MGILPPGAPETWTWDSLGVLLINVINLAVAVAGGAAVVFLIIGAYHYFTAFGNEEKAAAGKKTITWALIGAAVIALSWIVIQAVWDLASPTAPTLPSGTATTAATSPAGSTTPIIVQFPNGSTVTTGGSTPAPGAGATITVPSTGSSGTPPNTPAGGSGGNINIGVPSSEINIGDISVDLPSANIGIPNVPGLPFNTNIRF